MQRTPLRVSIDADSAVRAAVDDVSAVVEFQGSSGGGWRQAGEPRRFEPKVRHEWPLEFTLDQRDVRPGATYQLTATARDSRMAVVAQARAVRTFDGDPEWKLAVLFESSCLRLASLCPSGETCTMAKCVDARMLAVRGPRQEPDTVTSDGGTSVGELVPIAHDGESCETVGAVACGGELSRVPLRCEDAATDAGVERVWRAEPQCKEDELCDTTLSSDLRGMCRPVARECVGRKPDTVFCDQETMRVCSSMFESEVRPCADNARCIDPDNRAICACRNGFNADAAKNCVPATDCAIDNGGCDELKKCTMQQGAPVCGSCPAGFIDDGREGCSALLTSLSVADGALKPAFSPDESEYEVSVPLLVQRLALTASTPGAGRITFNGEEVPSGSAWTTPTLPLGEYLVDLALTAPMSGSVRSYKIRVVRGGAQTAYIKPSNTGSGDRFGVAMSLDADTLVIGSVYEDSAATDVDGDQSSQAADDSGAAYVFVRKANRWEQQAYLKPSDTAPGDVFGSNVAVSGNTIVVGAIHQDIYGLTGGSPDRPGAAYVYERKNGSWRSSYKLVPSGSMKGDLFGFGLSIEGDTIVVGSPAEAGGGAAYVFARTGETWSERQRLVPKVRASGNMFGGAAAQRGDTIVIGAYGDSSERSAAGSANVFVRNGETWSETQRLVPNPASQDGTFGYSLALGDDTLLVGAPRLSGFAAARSTTPGEVFVFERAGSNWLQKQVLKALVPRTSDSFGTSVAVSGSSALIGACQDMSGARGIGGDPSRRDASSAGAAYLYARDGTKWVSSLYLKASNADASDSFGFAVALSKNLGVVSAVWERSAATGIDGNQQNNSASTAGAAYVFE